MSAPAPKTAPAPDPLLEDLVARTISGREYASLHSDKMDQTLAELFGNEDDLCLMALGGYGRAELCPHSDIDLMFLSNGNASPEKIEKFLYALWDRGLKIGHSVRTQQEALDLAKKDSKILTSLLDSRIIAGNISLGESLLTEIPLLLSPQEKKEFVQAKLAERDERHNRYGDTRYVLEPNIKEGKGGLRDFQTLLWITGVLYGARTLDDLVNINILTRAEARRFAKSHAFLLTVRCHLHELAGRAEERLHFDIQPDLAQRLEYNNRHTGRAVERFMKHYFLVTRDMGDLTRILCAAIEHEDTPHVKTENFMGFEMLDGRLLFGKAQNLKTHPIDMLRLFRTAQDTGADIHPFALKDITRNLKHINGDLREDPLANALFIEILTSKKLAAQTLRRMNESGLLGKFVPDFGRIIALMQFDRYHYFTVDEHILRCVDMLHNLETGALQQDAPLTSHVIQNISARTELFVAMFLHDICKGRGGGHADLGGELALTLGPRFGLDGPATDLVSWLVHEHLLMSDTAFRRNMNDPKTIADFSARMRTPERLDLLFCLTTADIMGVGPGRWNAWKARLLEELYRKTRSLMDGEEPGMTEEVKLPVDYTEGETRITITNDESQGSTIVIVTTPDQKGLFSLLCGALSAEGANIMRAYINTVHDKKTGRIAVDRFIIQNASGLPFYQERRQDDLRQSIMHALGGTLDIAAKISAHKTPASKKDMVFDIPPEITINNTASGADTVIEIETRDRHGLLYDIACTFREEGLDIRAAKINTQGLRVIDSFYVQTAKRKKLTNDALQERLITNLKAAVAKP